MSAQLCFEGFPMDPAPWSPVPHTLARVREYFLGYESHGKTCYARRKHIARKLNIGVRTLARYIAYLAQQGWLKTTRRTARTVFREVQSPPPVKPSSGPSSGPSKEVTPESKKLWRKVVSSPLVLFRIPEHWRKRPSKMEKLRREMLEWAKSADPRPLWETL